MHISDDRGVPLYKRGSRGAEVRLLQQYLSQAGCAGCATNIDGSYGPATEAAVTAFQRAYNLPADGVVYLDTFEALSNAVSMRSSIITENKAVEVVTDAGPVRVNVPTAAAPLPPLALPGTLGPPTWLIVTGSLTCLAAFGWLLTRKSNRPALAGYRRRRRSRR